MKAVVYHEYGSPDVLRYEEVERPTPGDRQVLLKVAAASVNPLDAGFIRGGGRLVNGLRKPKFNRLGVDVAGLVLSVGDKVTRFKAGDKVFGVCIRDPQASSLRVWMCNGAFAEYACAPESTLATKPGNLTFAEAASAPVAALTALQGMRDKGNLQAGQRVLINGAAGGVGIFAVQIAKAFGANVTAVCSTAKLEMVRSIGADRVIDYTQQDFTRMGEHYDLFFDCAGNHPLSASKRVLTPTGIHLMVGDRSGRSPMALLSRLAAAVALSKFGSQKHVPFLAKPTKQDLEIICELVASGKVRPVIDKCYSLSEAAEALRYIEGGHARGKVVICMEHATET